MPKDVTKSSQKPEMTQNDMLNKWSYMKYDHGQLMFSDEHKDEFISDLRSVIRGKLVEYDKWLCGNSERLLNIPTSEQAVDEFLKDNQ